MTDEKQTQTLTPPVQARTALDGVAEGYVKLTLQVGLHHPYYVDAYYGPKAWKREAKKAPLTELLQQCLDLTHELAALSPVDSQDLRRKAFLAVQLQSMETFIRQQNGESLSFAEESLKLYDVKVPLVNIAELDRALAELDAALPGDGSLNERFSQYKKSFEIPKEHLEAVFTAAINEARRRTQLFIDLPTTETFTVEYVNDQVWTAYNWYQGDSKSLIQVNTDFPIMIDHAIGLASHEGYPGHHVFNALMEKHLVKQRGWVEYTIYPLFSAMSLLAEGSANYGVDITFNPQDKIAFSKDVLFPLAGLDPDQVDYFYRIQGLLKQLSYADNLVASRFLDGEISVDEAVELLVKYSLTSEAKSRQRLKFIEQNRTYVINYNLGQDIVQAYIDRKVGEGSMEKRWQVFADLLTFPKTASMMLAPDNTP